jgi:hypothetical protein
MLEKISRILFVVVFIFLSIPSILCAALLLSFVTLGSPFYFIGALRSLVGDESVPPFWPSLKTSAEMAIIAAIGFIAIFHFLRAASVFSLRGRIGLNAVPGIRRSALILLTTPLLLAFPYFFDTFPADFLRDDVRGFYLSGMALVPSILHVGVEIMNAKKQSALAD